MKKLFLGLAMLVCFTALAVAEITWSGTGRLVFVPFAVRGENTDTKAPTATYFGSENPWGTGGVRLGLGLVGKREQENMGFNFAFALESADGNFVAKIDDNNGNVWLKPFKGGGGGYLILSREPLACSRTIPSVSSTPVLAWASITMPCTSEETSPMKVQYYRGS